MERAATPLINFDNWPQIPRVERSHPRWVWETWKLIPRLLPRTDSTRREAWVWEEN